MANGFSSQAASISVLLAPGYNMAATLAFIDPFRAANYLSGAPFYRWALFGVGDGAPRASNGLTIDVQPLAEAAAPPDYGVVSTSWTPEMSYGALAPVIRRWARHGTRLVGLDTGAFALADAGVLDGRRATAHYEHIDAFAETFPRVVVSEDLHTADGPVFTASGGGGATDLALRIIGDEHGAALANAAARYLFHERIRPEGERQLPAGEPIGAGAPDLVRAAIAEMEAHLEQVVRIPEIAARLGVAQRRLERAFRRHVGKTPARYYAEIRLDRARGLVIQTEMAVSEIALACGFAGAEQFSRAYAKRFGAPPRADRQRGRVPFEFRAWPMHEKGATL